MIKKIIAAIFVTIASISILTVPVFADNACDEYKKKNPNDPNYALMCGSEDQKGETEAQDRVANILNTVFTWVGIIAVIVIIIGGIQYAISQGDPAKVSRAKTTILYAVIGLIVTLLAFAIVNFILEAAKGNKQG
jgi:quinol-cytochrome oxidoreductase complex cytochrome b subunit